MIYNNLFQQVLLDPTSRGADTLFIVSGYATASMAYRHLNNIPENVRINLIVGMTNREGIGFRVHTSFRNLAQEFPRFQCNYYVGTPPIHTKAYAWFNSELPIVGFNGSANYTQNAFLGGQGEAVAVDDPIEILEYYNLLRNDTVNCLNPDIGRYITFYDERDYGRNRAIINTEPVDARAVVNFEINNLSTELENITISLLNKQGELPQRSGLNWGQREGRERNQAYIKLKSKVYSSTFFPPRGDHFTILTDDGYSFNCVRAQDNGKAIHTHQNNSILGVYFRDRIGVGNGAPISTDDLRMYGRTDITFYRINSETFYMDFSVNR